MTTPPTVYKKYPRTLTPARYQATVRKLHAAYLGLAKVLETAEYFQAEQIARAMGELRRVPDELRVQVCTRCSKGGYFGEPDDPYTAHSCDHPDVPRYDVRTGEQIAS